MGDTGAHDDVGESFLARHGVSTAAAALGVFLLAKCFAASHFSTTTASALLTAAPVGVLLGTLTSTEDFLWPWLAAACLGVIAWHRYTYPEADAHRFVPLAAGALLVFAASLSVPEFLAIALAATTLVILISYAWTSGRLARLRARREGWNAERSGRLLRKQNPATAGRRGHAFSLAIGIPLASVGLLFLLYTLPNLWLPTDGIIFEGPQQKNRVVVGHVIEETSAWTTVLRAGDRRLERVRSDTVLFRRICVMDNSRASETRAPLMTWFLESDEKPDNRPCSEVVRNAKLRQNASYVCGSGIPEWEDRPRCKAARDPT